MHVPLNYLVYAVWPRRHICFLLESADMIPRSWSAWKWSVTQAIEETVRGFCFFSHENANQFVSEPPKKTKQWIQLASGVHQRSRLFRCEHILLLLYWVNTIANQDIGRKILFLVKMQTYLDMLVVGLQTANGNWVCMWALPSRPVYIQVDSGTSQDHLAQK